MLAPGDEILDYDGSTPLTVISNFREETTERVYNFEVDRTHNYFAGDVSPRQRMRHLKQLRQLVRQHMCINLRRGNIRMPE